MRKEEVRGRQVGGKSRENVWDKMEAGGGSVARLKIGDKIEQ